jgi:hypothetical protein
LQWATDNKDRGDGVNEPIVIGAVIDLGYCRDLPDDRFIKMISSYYRLMEVEYKSIEKPLPVNKDAKNDRHNDKLMRFRDRATIEFMHESIRKEVAKQIKSIGYTSYKLFDSVRGVFPEGGEAYPCSGFYAKSHIQICIRNPNCIKGFFLKREEIEFFRKEVSPN